MSKLIPDYDWSRMYHQQNLQIHGIHVSGTEILNTQNGQELFRLLRLRFSLTGAKVEPVPVKLPIVPRNKTPYSLIDGELLYQDKKLTFDDIIIEHVQMPPEEDAWHYKGYTFPFEGTHNPHRELRLNLRLSGYCPGRCFFCHRWHSHQLKPSQRYTPFPEEVLSRVVNSEGDGIFEHVEQIMYISELFGREDRFLESVQATRKALELYDYERDQLFGCCANDVRTEDGLRELRDLVNPARYTFTLEFFHNRQTLMGLYKGLPMEDVYAILSNARRVNFGEIQLNYLAGIDSLEECERGFRELAKRELIDSVGFSTFTTFSERQMDFRHCDAWEPTYYLHIIKILCSLGIKIYRPESYDMGSPYTALMERTELP